MIYSFTAIFISIFVSILPLSTMEISINEAIVSDIENIIRKIDDSSGNIKEDLIIIKSMKDLQKILIKNPSLGGSSGVCQINMADSSNARSQNDKKHTIKHLKKLRICIINYAKWTEHERELWGKQSKQFHTTDLISPEQDFLNHFDNISRHDPPFFQLTTKTSNRKVYVLGSIHNRHPQILLSSAVFSFLKDIISNCILFTEHDNSKMEKTLWQQFENQSKINEEWNISKFHLTEAQEELWNKIKNYPLRDSEDFTIEKITKFNPSYAIMLLYFRSVKQPVQLRKSEAVIHLPGFETIIKKIYQSKDILFLETPEEFIKSFESDDKTLRAFFVAAINKSNIKIIQVEENMVDLFFETKLINDYKMSIDNYDYLYYINKDVNISTKTRNEIWVKKIHEYLLNNNEGKPILIVCGAGHLSGKADEGNFLSLLINTGLFKKPLRIGSQGNWQELK